MYSISSLSSPYYFIAAMLCRLFGRPDINKFSSKWLSLLDAATNATIMDWDQILSENLASVIWNNRPKRTTSQRIYPPFFLAAYVMDAICFVSRFPLMGCKWTVQNPLPIQIYHKELWDSKFISYFYKICHGVMLPLYRMLYNKNAPRFSPEAKVDILPVERWFGEEFFIYVRVFGSIASPHVLPLYVLDKLLAREISYQTCGVGGISKELKDKKKAIWPQFLVACGAFSLFDLGNAFKGVDNMLSLRLFKFPGRQFDPYDVIKNFTTAVKIKVFTKEDDLLMISSSRKVHRKTFFLWLKFNFRQQNSTNSNCT